MADLLFGGTVNMNSTCGGRRTAAVLDRVRRGGAVAEMEEIRMEEISIRYFRFREIGEHSLLVRPTLEAK